MKKRADDGSRARAQQHLRAARKYHEQGHYQKARAHFGRAEHYRAQEFGGLWSWLTGPAGRIYASESNRPKYECARPSGGRVWLCQKCGCVDTVVYALNTGDRCVRPGCNGTRNKAVEAHAQFIGIYETVYRSQTLSGTERLRFLREADSGDPYDLVPDEPPVDFEVDGIDKVTTVEGVPNPTSSHSAWVCQQDTRVRTCCNTVRLLLRVMNNMSHCSNPRCDGTRDMAISAYDADEGAYHVKFRAAVSAERKIMQYNEPIPLTPQAKESALMKLRSGSSPEALRDAIGRRGALNEVIQRHGSPDEVHAATQRLDLGLQDAEQSRVQRPPQDQREPPNPTPSTSELCIICQDRERNTALAPCGHHAFCDVCVARLKAPLRCPVCRQQAQPLRLYASFGASQNIKNARQNPPKRGP
jgi:hypothetical protein